MKSKEEKPTMYIITGHRGAGKTTQLAELLPDHPFMPEVYQENKKFQAVEADYKKYFDEEDYVKHLIAAEKESENFINQQKQNKENIYLETFSHGFSADYWGKKKHEGYDNHVIFVMNDTLDVSLQRLAGTPPYPPYSDFSKVVEDDRSITNYNLNTFGAHVRGRLDIYDGTGPKPKLLATFQDGKIIIASPKILQKEWLAADSPLRQRINKYLGLNQKHTSVKNQAVTKQETAKQEKRNRPRL